MGKERERLIREHGMNTPPDKKPTGAAAASLLQALKKKEETEGKEAGETKTASEDEPGETPEEKPRPS